MENIYINVAGFAVCAAIIIFSGTKLSFYGDRIADLTGLGKAWIGLILMASVTSLPELINGISAVAIVNAPDLAAGDIFGSCVFNLLILSLLDTQIRKPILSSVKSSHIVAALFGIVLLMLCGIAIYLSHEIPAVGWISSASLVIFGVYLITIWCIFKFEQGSMTTSAETTGVPTAANAAELKQVIGGYIFHAVIVIGAALFLPYFGEHIAAHTGMGNSFFGTLFIAATTSLPELVVSLSALRMGSLDMAVGNLLGSNIFNIFILGIDDIFYKAGPLFSAIAPSHMLTIFVTIMMTAVVGLGLFLKPKKKQIWLLNIDTFVIAFLYVSLMTYLFFNK